VLMRKLLITMMTRYGAVLPRPGDAEQDRAETSPASLQPKTPSPPPPAADADGAAARQSPESGERLTRQTEGVFRRFVAEMDGRRGRAGRCVGADDTRHPGSSSSSSLSPSSDPAAAADDADDDDDQLT